MIKKKYVIALGIGSKLFNCRTICVSAKDENDAYAIAKHLKPNERLGEIREVYY